MLKEHTTPEGWHQVVFVETPTTKPERGFVVSLDYEYLLMDALNLSQVDALKIQAGLWRRGYRFKRDFNQASVYRDCVAVCHDKTLGNNLVSLVRSLDDGTDHS